MALLDPSRSFTFKASIFTVIFFFRALTLVCGSTFTPIKHQDHDSLFYYALKSSDIDAVLSRYQHFRLLGKVGSLEDYYLLETEKSYGDTLVTSANLFKRSLESLNLARFHTALLQGHDAVEWVSLQKPRKLDKRFPLGKSKKACEDVKQEMHFRDSLFTSQWHLVNCDYPGNDLNVTPVWRQGVFGENVVVCIVDDGVDMEHPDLKDNYFPEGSYDFNDHQPVPKPRLYDDRHGTRCAGEIASIPNDVCGVGVSYRAKVSGLRILSAEITEADEAAAVQYAIDKNHIYSCSWGPSDDGKTLEGPSQIVKDAFYKGIKDGRDGKGVIYVFATGNGGFNEDNCNYDGYTNSMYTLTVGAITHRNEHPPYSEMCSAQLCVTYSSSVDTFIQTIDFHNACAHNHGGTSAAAPLAAGVLALALSVRPDLTWRDVQHIVIQSAIPIDVGDRDWQKTPAGHMVSHKYGYGKVDAAKTVEVARFHRLLGPQTRYSSPVRQVNLAVDGKEGTCVSDSIVVDADALSKVNLKSLEHVTVAFSATHERRGALEIVLESPGKVRSVLGARRPYDDDSKVGFQNWTFLSVFHWQEPAAGRWTLQVCNTHSKFYKGVFQSWQLNLYGDSVSKVATPITQEPSLPTATLLATVSAISTPHGNSTDSILENGSEQASRGSISATALFFIVCVVLALCILVVILFKRFFHVKAKHLLVRMRGWFYRDKSASYQMFDIRRAQDLDEAFES